MPLLPDLDLLKITTKSLSENSGTFVFEPLSPGYGVTIGNALRRVLIASLPGSAVTAVKISGTNHEFSAIKGVKEDAVELILNIKELRLKSSVNEPVKLKLIKKSAGNKPVAVYAKDIKKNASVEIANPDKQIATLDAKGSLSIEMQVEQGRGYMPTEEREGEQLPADWVLVDAIFTPIKKVHYEIEKTRVGQEINYDKLTIDLTTDGTIAPSVAISQACTILNEHFDAIINELPTKVKGKKK